MSCQHEWTESIRCSRCGQAVESRIEVGRQLDDALELLTQWANGDSRGWLGRYLKTVAVLRLHGRRPA